MKKTKNTNLTLNKKIISNLKVLNYSEKELLKGGTGFYTCQSLQGGCGTGGPVPSGRPACNDK
ncbi:hypothetical protein [Ascidiimonas sp. W6]|uniref:hypothetical protein n=1 Tax=Ascidiimonas meishanensis TaxID=3128903 RepID=UPI0030EF14EA